MPHRSALRAYAALALGVVAISWSAIFVRWTQMPGVASAFYRVFIAALILWAILIARRTRLQMNCSALWLAILGGAFFAGDLGFYNVSVLRTSAGSATFLGNNAPLFVAIISWIATRRAPSGRFWIAFAIALVGACLIVSPDLQHSGTRSAADLMAVAASFCFALYLSLTERLREAGSTLTLLAISTTSSAAVLLLVAALTHSSLRIPSTQSLASLIGLGVVCQLVGYFGLTYALGHLPATVSSVVMLTMAPITAVLALILFKERMTFLQVFGGALVLLGVWIVSRSGRESTPPSSSQMAQVAP